jgi:hypothetical protein
MNLFDQLCSKAHILIDLFSTNQALHTDISGTYMTFIPRHAAVYPWFRFNQVTNTLASAGFKCRVIGEFIIVYLP